MLLNVQIWISAWTTTTPTGQKWSFLNILEFSEVQFQSYFNLLTPWESNCMIRFALFRFWKERYKHDRTKRFEKKNNWVPSCFERFLCTVVRDSNSFSTASNIKSLHWSISEFASIFTPNWLVLERQYGPGYFNLSNYFSICLPNYISFSALERFVFWKSAYKYDGTKLKMPKKIIVLVTLEYSSDVLPK